MSFLPGSVPMAELRYWLDATFDERDSSKNGENGRDWMESTTDTPDWLESKTDTPDWPNTTCPFRMVNNAYLAIVFHDAPLGCSAQSTCGSHGSCANQHSTTCVCFNGRSGSGCNVPSLDVLSKGVMSAVLGGFVVVGIVMITWSLVKGRKKRQSEEEQPLLVAGETRDYSINDV